MDHLSSLEHRDQYTEAKAAFGKWSLAWQQPRVGYLGVGFQKPVVTFDIDGYYTEAVFPDLLAAKCF
jgi:hypothetical protein